MGVRKPAWEAAYCEFFEARQRSYMRTAYAILGSWHGAEDATQSAFAQLYVYWPRIRDGSVDAYARRVLVNACMRSFRLKQHETTTEVVPELGEPSPDHAGRVDLTQALSQLSIADRAVVTLRFLDDLAVAEVADLLDIPEGTVKSRTARALAKLAPTLGVFEESEST